MANIKYERSDQFLVTYPITVNVESLLQYHGITLTAFNKLSEKTKREYVEELADYYLQSSSIDPVITDPNNNEI